MFSLLNSYLINSWVDRGSQAASDESKATERADFDEVFEQIEAIDWSILKRRWSYLFPLVIVETSGPSKMWPRFSCSIKSGFLLNHDSGAKCIDVQLSPTSLGWIRKKRRQKRKGYIKNNNGAQQNHKVSKFTAFREIFGWSDLPHLLAVGICWHESQKNGSFSVLQAIQLKNINHTEAGDSWADVHEKFAWTPSQRCVLEGECELVSWGERKPESHWDFGGVF